MTESFDTRRTALIAVDFQDECASSQGAWPIHNGSEVLANAKAVLAGARARRIPIILTKHVLEPNGSDSFRLEPSRRSGRPLHSVRGATKSSFCKQVTPRRGDIIIEKQRWTGFYCTKMDLVLRRLDVDHLIMMGIWTEACFETTVWDALWRDYRITIVKDACSSATDVMHMTGILDLANWLYGGSIIQTKELVKAFRGRPYKSWSFKEPSRFLYRLDNIQQLYDSI